MSTLREYQLGFARAVLDASFAADFGAQVRARGLSGARRIQVYRNNRAAGLRDALAALYPVIRRLVGDAFFAQVVSRYVKTYPSESGDIHRYGGAFSVLLAGTPGVSDHPYLPDVARLEWLYHSVFHRNRVPALDLAEIASLPDSVYDRLQFRLQPAAQLYASRYPVLQIWQANQEDANGEQTIRLDAGETLLLVRRDTAGVVFQPLTPGEYVLLEQLAAAATLTDAFERAREVEPQFDLGTALAQHVLHATLTGVCITGDESPVSPHHGG